MKISAILCNYNGGEYLRDAIQSILEQERPVDEFIIVDDGSTDQSREIIEEFVASSTIRFIPHETNQGQAAGFNTAIAAATGDLLCFMDSDDLWFPQKVGIFETMAQENPDCVLFHHNLAIIQGDQQTDELFMSAMSQGDLYREWRKHIFFPYFAPTAGLAIRADIARKVLPVPENLKHSADSYLTRSTIAHGPVVCCYKALGGYRRHETNAVHGNTQLNTWTFFEQEVAPHLHQYYKSLGIWSPIPKLLIWDMMNWREKVLHWSPLKIYKWLKKDK
jgi:glycosyltransferase involved in cell wall biosynthesis